MANHHSFEEPTLFPMDEGSPIVPDQSPFVGIDPETFAASCAYAAAVKTKFTCVPEKCPEYLLKCF